MRKQLVDLQVPCLGFVEEFVDEVHRTLDGPSPPGGSGASISMGAGLGSSCPFASGGSSEPGDPVTPWPGGAMAASEDWDPAAASASVSSVGRSSSASHGS
jgi:hypothetical protein